MYEISREYLDRLLRESGVKLGGAKASAMAAIIELLDTNALDGLLASIRADYDAMKNATKNLSVFQQQEQHCKERIAQLQRTRDSLNAQIWEAEKRVKALKEEEQTAQFEADLRGCREEERSRLIAYEAAIRIGKAAYGDRIPSDAMNQILRSASNVAAGQPMSKPHGDNIDSPISTTTRNRKEKVL